jgi:hypothetical protein
MQSKGMLLRAGIGLPHVVDCLAFSQNFRPDSVLKTGHLAAGDVVGEATSRAENG